MTDLAGFYQNWRRGRALEPIPLDSPVDVQDLQTPALLIDLDVFEANLRKMQAYLDSVGIALRAHTKMHKCPIVARKQVEAGARGVCAAKITEAEVMADGGIEDILITSPLASVDKLNRFIALRRESPGVKVVVDTVQTAAALNERAAAEGFTAEVFVDVDPGLGRTGIAPGVSAVELVETVADASHLGFAGLQMYAGHCMHIEGHAARQQKYTRVMAPGRETLDLLADRGIEVPVFSGGGTGTYNMEATLGLVNELQAGSYAFMDIEYRDIGGESSNQFLDFEVSLFVLATAISQPQQRLITVDAGFKSMASDKMPPQFRDVEGVVFHWGGDEHGIVQLNNPSREIGLGNKLPLLTPHCDPTVNLHDYYFPYRDGQVTEIWPITARGFSL